MPVPIGPMLRGRGAVEGRELEFIVRSLVELKLQVEELRRRLNDERPGVPVVGDGGSGGASRGWIGELQPPVGIEPPGAGAPPNIVTIVPGMTMAEIERAAIEAALKETRGNRRKAADMLGIGERTLYRKLREYQIPDSAVVLD